MMIARQIPPTHRSSGVNTLHMPVIDSKYPTETDHRYFDTEQRYDHQVARCGPSREGL
jgi:hypothetical protein